MGQNPEEGIHDVVHRGRNRDWLEEAQESRRRRRRRILGLSAAGLVGLTIATFLVQDGPRRSGMLDALGVTCGEFVTEYGESQQEIFEPWPEHLDTLREAAEERPSEDGNFHVDLFTEEVEDIALQLEAEPSWALFRGWSPPDRTLSAEPVGDKLFIGHHEDIWVFSEAVSIADPATGQTQWSVELEHPTRDDWREPTRVLNGVGSAGDYLLLQTPAVNGDTDVVAFDTASDTMDCLRLEGAVDTVEVLDSQQRAWPNTMNLNHGRTGESEFLLVHGLDEEEEDPYDGMDPVLEVSRVTVDPLEDELEGPMDEVYPPENEYTQAEAETVEVSGDFQTLDLESIQPLGEQHYFLTWENGYIIFE